MTDNEIVKALDRLKATKDYLREQYQERVKSCPYPELKPIAKQTYEDNKKAFNIAIKAIEEFNRQKAKIEALIAGQETLQKYIAEQKAEIERLKAELEDKQFRCDSCVRIGLTRSEHRVCVNQAKAEAIKEFAESLKRLKWSEVNRRITEKDIDATVKEMVGETNA